MLFSISPFIGNNPFHAFPATSQTLQRTTIFGPDEALIVCIPVEFQVFLVPHVLGNCQVDAKPVRGPAGAERGADMSGFEIMRGSIFERGAVDVRNRVDGELDMVSVGSYGLEEFTWSVSTNLTKYRSK